MITAADLAYTMDKEIWALLAGGVPINANNVIWKRDRGASQDDLIFAAMIFNANQKQNHHIQLIKVCSTEEDGLVTIWSTSRAERTAAEPRLQLAMYAEWYDAHMQVKEYAHTDCPEHLQRYHVWVAAGRIARHRIRRCAPARTGSPRSHA